MRLMTTFKDTALTLDKHKLAEIAQRFGITYLLLFGSVARNAARPESDVDLAVRFGAPTTLFEMAGAKLAFEQLFGHQVDLIPLDSAYSFVRENIEQEAIVLYDAATEPMMIAE